MLKKFFRKERKLQLDKNILRKNSISLLFLDERWRKLYDGLDKPQDIINYESEIEELLKEQARLKEELERIDEQKRTSMDKIVELSPEVFDNGSEKARKDMDECRRKIKELNLRATEIEGRINEIPELINENNLKMLENTVDFAYKEMNRCVMRMEELEGLVDEARIKLRGYVEEMQLISENYSVLYSSIHDLIGSEETDRLDKDFLLQKHKRDVNEPYDGGNSQGNV